jgi:hypothetical protein
MNRKPNFLVVKVPELNPLNELNKLKRSAMELGQDYLQMMQNPNCWGQWPYLPLRNRRREAKDADPLQWVLGYLVDSNENCKFTVFIGNFWVRNSRFPTNRYSSFEAILADGWEID